MKKLFIYIFSALIVCLGFYACDSTTSPDDLFGDHPAITEVNITPQNVEFSPVSDGIKDTTVVVYVQVTAINLGNQQLPAISVTDRFTGESVLEAYFEPGNNPEEFILEIPFDTKTTFFKEYISTIFISGESSSGNYAQASINLTGFSLIAPEILEVDNPESVQRPESGTQLYPFTAKVTDAEGQDTIEGVYVRVINPETGEVNSSPFKLYDNGTQGDDAVANNSVYTVTFPVDPSSQLQTFELFYYAIDRGGLISDTVKTTFSIVE